MAVFSTLIKKLQLLFSLQVEKISTGAFSKLQKIFFLKIDRMNFELMGSKQKLHNFAKPLPTPHMAGTSTGKVSFQ